MTHPYLARCWLALLSAGAACITWAADHDVHADTTAGEHGGVWEQVGETPVRELLPERFLRSSSYEVEPAVAARDNFYHFRVESDHARYRIASLGMLRIRLHEISTIDEIQAGLGIDETRLDRSPGGRRGVSSEHVADILANPLGTASQLLGNLTHNLEETFGSTGDETDAGAGLRGDLNLNPGPHKRSAAAQLGVDVYSTNPALQALLDDLAAARSSGEPERSISPRVQNIYAARPFGSGVFAQRMESLIKNTAAEDLNALVGDKLARLDLPADARITFVTQPAFTPRTRLFATAYLELLDDVEHLDLLVRAANTALTEVDALAYVHYLRMLAHYQLTHDDLTEVVTETRFPTLATRGGEAVLPLPLDYLAWTAPVAGAADALGALRRERGLGRFIVLLAGTPTDRAFEELSARDVELRSRYSF